MGHGAGRSSARLGGQSLSRVGRSPSEFQLFGQLAPQELLPPELLFLAGYGRARSAAAAAAGTASCCCFLRGQHRAHLAGCPCRAPALPPLLCADEAAGHCCSAPRGRMPCWGYTPLQRKLSRLDRGTSVPLEWWAGFTYKPLGNKVGVWYNGRKDTCSAFRLLNATMQRTGHDWSIRTVCHPAVQKKEGTRCPSAGGWTRPQLNRSWCPRPPTDLLHRGGEHAATRSWDHLLVFAAFREA